MTDSFSATILQNDIVSADAEANHRHLGQLIAGLGTTDLIVLPEVFNVGFGTTPEAVAQPEDDSPTLRWMQQMARQRDCAIAGSIPIVQRCGGQARFLNRLHFVRPDGTYDFYDKRHIFVYGGEWAYSSGGQRTVAEWRGVRFLLQICYDLRFPLWNRNFGDYDVAIFCGNWPTARIQQWAALLRARAIENQAYIIGVNRVGNDPLCDYPGQSAIIHPYGHDLASGGSEEGAATAVLDLAALRTMRERFPVLREQDSLEFIMQLTSGMTKQQNNITTPNQQ